MSTAPSPAAHTIVYDVETAPFPDSYLDLIAPEFSAPANYKDEAKISASIAEQKERWKERAALSPLTGKVLAIGIRDLDGSFRVIDGNGNEEQLLTEWTELVHGYPKEQFVGFNCFLFDIPFLMKRQWKLGVKPFIRPGLNLRYMEDWIDLRDIWQMGDRQAEGSLDTLCKYLGIGAKNGDGKDFYKLWASDRAAALAYLENDINMTTKLGERLGVIV